jgi:hypothetical protein
LKTGDEISLWFRPDYHTTAYLYHANVHADVLTMDVHRNNKHVATWLIAECSCPENSARMCKGVPYPEHWASMEGYGKRQIA